MKRLLVLVLLAAPRAASAQCLPIPNGGTRALVWLIFDGEPFTQQTLVESEPMLNRFGIQIAPPNAAGERTKIGDPISGHWTRIGFGEGYPVWIQQDDVYVPIACPPATTARGAPWFKSFFSNRYVQMALGAALGWVANAVASRQSSVTGRQSPVARAEGTRGSRSSTGGHSRRDLDRGCNHVFAQRQRRANDSSLWIDDRGRTVGCQLGRSSGHIGADDPHPVRDRRRHVDPSGLGH
jgi:hypothetical protein